MTVNDRQTQTRILCLFVGLVGWGAGYVTQCWSCKASRNQQASLLWLGTPYHGLPAPGPRHSGAGFPRHARVTGLLWKWLGLLEEVQFCCCRWGPHTGGPYFFGNHGPWAMTWLPLLPRLVLVEDCAGAATATYALQPVQFTETTVSKREVCLALLCKSMWHGIEPVFWIVGGGASSFSTSYFQPLSLHPVFIFMNANMNMNMNLCMNEMTCSPSDRYRYICTCVFVKLNLSLLSC